MTAQGHPRPKLSKPRAHALPLRPEGDGRHSKILSVGVCQKRTHALQQSDVCRKVFRLAISVEAKVRKSMPRHVHDVISAGRPAARGSRPPRAKVAAAGKQARNIY